MQEVLTSSKKILISNDMAVDIESLSNNTILIGAYGHDVAYENEGKAYLYSKD